MMNFMCPNIAGGGVATIGWMMIFPIITYILVIILLVMGVIALAKYIKQK